MNAAEARRRRGGSTLVERTRSDPARAARIDALVAAASVEHIIQNIMDRENVSAAELARRIKVKPPQISRDLHGGLSKATVSRLVLIAQALGYDFVPAFVPRSPKDRRRRFFEAYSDLLEPVRTRTIVAGKPERAATNKDQAKAPRRTARKVA